MQPNIDFKSIINLDQKALNLGKGNYIYQVIVVFVVLVLTCAALLLFAEFDMAVVFSTVAFCAFIAYSLLVVGNTTIKDSKQFMQGVANALHMQYAESATAQAGGSDMFPFGYSQISCVLSGTCEGNTARIYYFDVSSGKSSILMTMFEVTLPLNAPDIVLMSDSDLLSLPVKISLEGDFGKSFWGLYTEKGGEEVAYQIFTPDFMQWCIDHKKGLNFASKGQKLFMFTEGRVASIQELSVMIETDIELLKLLLPKFQEVRSGADQPKVAQATL